MRIELQSVAGINSESRDIAGYDRVVANAIILTVDNRLLLQRRGADDKAYPNALVLFGGGVESGEGMAVALCRELTEEIEAKASPDELIMLGAHTFERRGVRPLIVTFFWHDRHGTIGACHEDEPVLFANAVEITTMANVHPVLPWALQECVRRGLIPA